MKDILHRTQFEARRTGGLAKSETPETPEAVTVMRVLAAQRIPSELIDAASDVVARRLGVRPSDPINISEPRVRGILGPAISWLKNGGLDQLVHTAEQLVDLPPQPAVQDTVSTAPIEPAQERPVSEPSSALVHARGDTDDPALAEAALFESVEAVFRKETATASRVGLDRYQQGAIGALLNASAPLDVVRIVGAIFGRSGAVAGMARLSREASEHAGATEGLRKAVVDYICRVVVDQGSAAFRS